MSSAAVIMGHALVDVLAPVTDDEVVSLGLQKGTMELVDADAAKAILSVVTPEARTSGGSAANTAVCLAAFGGSARFVGRVADDDLGLAFAEDIRAAGVAFDTPSEGAEATSPTGSCVVLVTPDAEKTMCTNLGAGADLTADDIPAEAVTGASVLYMEGYVWGPEPTTGAARRAIAAARQAGTTVSFSASDPGWVAVQRAALLELLGLADLLFANEPEALALSGEATIDDAVEWLLERCPRLVITLGPAGSLVADGDGRRERVPAVPVDRVVDTTGAGDSFAGGYLFGLIEGRDPSACARLGALAASEVVSHLGARPQTDLRALAETAGLL